MGWPYRRMIESKVGKVVADMPPSAAAEPPKTAEISIKSTSRRKEPPNPERRRAWSRRSRSWHVYASVRMFLRPRPIADLRADDRVVHYRDYHVTSAYKHGCVPISTRWISCVVPPFPIDIFLSTRFSRARSVTISFSAVSPKNAVRHWLVGARAAFGSKARKSHRP
jgi:hypothetical protein